MNLLNSIKAMLQAVGSKTASDKANKGVMLVKTNGDSAGEPAGYVTKEVLAEIVRQELFSILSNDGSEATTLSKFIGLDGSSMKSITAGNLASVLGASMYVTLILEATSVTDLNDEVGSSKRFTRKFVSAQSAPANLPNDISASRFFLEIYNMSNYYLLQKIYTIPATGCRKFLRSKLGDNNWSSWEELT